MMATFHERSDGGRALLVKGAPGVVLERSTRRQSDGGRTALDDDTRRQLEDDNRALAAEGFRVLAVARRASRP